MKSYFPSKFWDDLVINFVLIACGNALSKLIFLLENSMYVSRKIDPERFTAAGEGFVFVVEIYSFFSKRASDLSVIQLC